MAAAITFLSLTTPAAAAQYGLVDDYRPGSFYDKFTFFNETDPTDGTVVYDDFDTASDASLIAYTDYSTIMRVDGTNIIPGDQGRPSVRITSDKKYNHGLLIADILHMPPSLCSLWPALWMTGPDWPKGGEIDIIEGVNTQTANLMTLHTTDDCRDPNIAGYSADMLGDVTTSSCWNKDPNQAENAGCQIAAPAAGLSSALTAPATYGSSLNAQGGGVVAMEWTSNAITIWLWSRYNLPSSIATATNLSNTSPHPNPSDADWGVPLAVFGGSGCSLDSHIKDQQIVVNIDFCGSWAGEASVWAAADGDAGSCAAVTGTDCASYVRNNPGAFVDAFWEFGAFRWFEKGAGS
ncbi:glycoside hydrolase family 16 protein, partial [Saccharata proteae CBS 121410]